MHDEETPAARRNHGRRTQVVQRMDLLNSRFSRTEIDRLSKLQVLHREQPDVLDLPPEECRLRFARWLVEHGKLGNDDGSSFDGRPWDGETSCESQRHQESMPNAPAGVPSGYLDGGPTQAGAVSKHPQDWHLSLSGGLSRIRQGLAWVARIGRQLGSWLFIPGDRSAAFPSSLYGPYPYYSPWSYMEDPWFWMHFR